MPGPAAKVPPGLPSRRSPASAACIPTPPGRPYAGCPITGYWRGNGAGATQRCIASLRRRAGFARPLPNRIPLPRIQGTPLPWFPRAPPPKRRETKDIQEGDPQKEHTHAADSFASPSLEEVLRTADLRAIPRDCAEKFFHEQTANEWVNRQGHPLRQWPAQLQGFAVSWRAVEHRRAAVAAVAAVRSPARPSRRGAFAPVAPAEAFTSNQI